MEKEIIQANYQEEEQEEDQKSHGWTTLRRGLNLKQECFGEQRTTDYNGDRLSTVRQPSDQGQLKEGWANYVYVPVLI